MATVTTPIMTDATGQSIDSKLNSLLGKMDNLAAAFQPNASGIVYSNTTSGLTGDDVQEAIDEMAADVSEIKQSLSNKANKRWTQILNETAPSRNYDQTKTLADGNKFSDYNELMFVMMNANNLRVMGTTVVPIEVFTNGAAYVLGCGDIGATYLYNAVFIYTSDTSVEIAITANSNSPIASYVFRIMAR